MVTSHPIPAWLSVDVLRIPTTVTLVSGVSSRRPSIVNPRMAHDTLNRFVANGEHAHLWHLEFRVASIALKPAGTLRFGRKKVWMYSVGDNCSRSYGKWVWKWWWCRESFHRLLSIGFKAGLWLGHSRTFTFLFWSHSIGDLAVWLGSLSCWNVNLHCSLRSFALWSRSSRIHQYLAPIIIIFLYPYKYPSPCHWKTSPKHDVATIRLHGRDGVRWVISCARFLPDVVLCIQPKELNFRLGPQKFLPHALRVFHTWLFVNSRWAVMWLFLRSGFCLSTLP